jgi:protein involved in temperature-dependent protein secretion
VAALQAAWVQVADLRAELATVTAERDALRRAAAAALADADGDGGPPSWIGELGQALGPVLELAGPLVAAWAAGRGAPPSAPAPDSGPAST